MDYKEYHRAVVEACVKLMGEANRQFFDSECTYHEEYDDHLDPCVVAKNQLEALD